jgi:hypothetical protein
VNGNRRYRYYVSRRSLKSGAGHNANGWRIRTLEIEQRLALALAAMLDDPPAIIHELDRNLNAAKIKSVLETRLNGAHVFAQRGVQTPSVH